MNFLGKVGVVAQTSIHLLLNHIEMVKDKLKFNSKTIHGGQQPEKGYGAVMPPVYLTSTYAQSTPGGHHDALREYFGHRWRLDKRGASQRHSPFRVVVRHESFLS